MKIEDKRSSGLTVSDLSPGEVFSFSTDSAGVPHMLVETHLFVVGEIRVVNLATGQSYTVSGLRDVWRLNAKLVIED